jgi:hypothetical protein
MSEALESFDNFLLIMDEQLDALTEEAALYKVDLDFSLHSLSKLEDLFIKMSENIENDKKNSLIVFFARYLGEIVIKNFGGKWTLPIDDPKNVNFNTPVIIGHSPIEGLEFSPIGVIRAFSLRKRAGMLKTAIDAQASPNPIDLSGLVED